MKRGANHRRWRISALAGLLLVCGAAGARAAPPPLVLVSADDPLLASLFIARGATDPVVVFDPRDQELVAAYAATWQGPVHCFHRPPTPATVVEMMKKVAGEPCTQVGDVLALARRLWPRARRAVTVTDSDYGWLLAAAAFAAASDTALLPVSSTAGVTPQTLSDWPLDLVYLTPPARRAKASIAAVVPQTVEVGTADRFVDELHAMRPDTHVLVIANAADRAGIFSPSGLSLLAPLLSGAHRAPLLLVPAADSAAIERQAYALIDRVPLAVTHVVLVGDELALRSHRLPDPVQAAGGPEARGGGVEVRVELFSQIEQDQPQDLSVGRIVAESAAQASVLLARQLHGGPPRKGRPVIFLTNADEVFALGETISRATVEELRNVSVPVKAYFRDEITPVLTKKVLDQTDLLMWEGHPRDLTLEEMGGVAATHTPRLVVLQGCYTLDRSDPFILIEKGTQAIVATSSAIYSASGSAFARAFIDAVAYGGRDLGTAVRDARNYLLALTLLKRARGHADWRKTYRAALAFALWGDPTTRAPLAPGRTVKAPVQWAVQADALSLSIPQTRLRESIVGRYRTAPVPRTMLGGLLLRGPDATERRLKDLYFTATTMPAAPAVCPPGDGWNVVSLFAPRSRTLTVLARPDWDVIEAPGPYGTFRFPLASEAAACALEGRASARP